MQKFIIEYTNDQGTANEPSHRLEEMEAETLEIATTRVSNLLKGTGVNGAVIYAARVALQAERRINVAEITASGSVPKAAGSTVLDRYNAPDLTPSIPTL